MAEGEALREYKRGDTVRLTVELRDEAGVESAHTTARREGSEYGTEYDPETERPTGLTNDLDLNGFVSGAPKQASVVMRGTVENQVPGIYECRVIKAYDVNMMETRHRLDPASRFRIVEEPDADREGPEIMGVGEFS